MAKFRVAGKTIPRRESVLKATGRARYTSDLTFPDMVYGAILRSPYAHAKVIAINAQKARNVPGVLGILEPEDVPRVRFNCAANPPSALLIKDEEILTDHPRHVGDRIMAVVGETRQACERALHQIQIEYDLQPAVFTIKKALAGDAPLIHPQFSKRNLVKTITAEQGDVAQGLAQSDFIFSEEFQTPSVQHTALEPVGCVCHFTKAGELTVWSTSQAPFQERRILAEILDLPESNIRIVKPVVGGGFGSRQQLHNQHVGALLSKLVNRPVKIINTREEEMYASAVRHEVIARLKIGVDKTGLVKAFDAQVFFNIGPYVSHSLIVAAAASRKLQYRVPNYRYQGHCVLTNAPVAGAMRGYGNPQLTFAREVLMDRVATELKMDPVALRLLNHVQVGENFPAAAVTIKSCAIEDCVRGAARIKSKIDQASDRPSMIPGEDIIQAWGLAFGCHTSGPSSNEGLSACVILANDDGTVQLMTGSADIGQGSETTLSQVAAEVLGIRLDEVALTAADTRNTPYDTGTFASSQMYVAGNAVKQAAENLLVRLRHTLAEAYGCNSDEIIWEQGHFNIPGGKQHCHLNFKQAVRSATFHQKGTIIIGSASFKAESSPPPFAVCWAKVAVDRRTDSVQVLHVIEAVDVGTAINPEIVIGQVEGGISMGVGYAMMEEIPIGHRTRKPMATDLLHYRIPLSTDMPQTHVYIAKSYEPTGPLGAKSVGELATVPVAPAIANAVAKALGEPITRLPLSRRVVPASYRLGRVSAATKDKGAGDGK